jgi:hypothetical protein
MTEIISRPPDPPDQQLSVARVMETALGPFRLGEELSYAMDLAWRPA